MTDVKKVLKMVRTKVAAWTEARRVTLDEFDRCRAEGAIAFGLEMEERLMEEAKKKR